MGPVQVLVVGFTHPTFNGEVLAEFDRLRDAGVVRLVDLLLVARAEDGSLESVPLPHGAPPELGTVAAALLGEVPDADQRITSPDEEGSGWSLAAVPPGTTAAVALLEHLWASPLTEALARAGGRPLEETWLGPEDRERLEALLEHRTAARS
jgi:Family of unknown function (DUF6325)